MLEFILGNLLVWRLARLLAKEDGPFEIICDIRERLGNGQLGKLMDCMSCSSVWISLPVAMWLGETTRDEVLLWPALSAGSMFLEGLYGLLRGKTYEDE